MRLFRKKKKPPVVLEHWFCRRCETICTCDFIKTRSQCLCGHWMEHKTTQEIDELRPGLAFE